MNLTEGCSTRKYVCPTYRGPLRTRTASRTCLPTNIGQVLNPSGQAFSWHSFGQTKRDVLVTRRLLLHTAEGLPKPLFDSDAQKQVQKRNRYNSSQR